MGALTCPAEPRNLLDGLRCPAGFVCIFLYWLERGRPVYGICKVFVLCVSSVSCLSLLLAVHPAFRLLVTGEEKVGK